MSRLQSLPRQSVASMFRNIYDLGDRMWLSAASTPSIKYLASRKCLQAAARGGAPGRHSMVKADKPKKEKRTAEAAADGPEKKIKKSKKEKKELPEEEAEIVVNGTAEPAADVAMEEPVSEKKKKKKRKSEAPEVAEAEFTEPPSTGKKKKKKAEAEQTAAVPIAEAPVEGTVIVTAEDEDVDEEENDEVHLYG